MALVFDKYHGLGNDFLVVDLELPADMPVSRAMALCDRHFGVGGDGVLVVSPPSSSEARAKMTVINADGSTPEMCGNGLRCVALHLCRRADEDETSFLVETGAGLLLCEVQRKGDEAQVRTAIGKGTHRGSLDYTWQGDSLHFERITTGNPHAICFREQLDPYVLDQVGHAVSALMEHGCNVEIATLKSPTEIELSVWERGVGRTLACGTGAAATAIEAVRSGRSPADSALLVRLPGGPLSITVSKSLEAHLRGPSQWVFSGTTSF